MALINVTVNRGILISESYNSSSVVSENLTMSGTSMILKGGKVVSFDGKIVKTSSNEEIGTFSYKNGDSSMLSSIDIGYYSTISIYREVDSELQIEATNALIAGVEKLQASV